MSALDTASAWAGVTERYRSSFWNNSWLATRESAFGTKSRVLRSRRGSQSAISRQISSENRPLLVRSTGARSLMVFRRKKMNAPLNKPSRRLQIGDRAVPLLPGYLGQRPTLLAGLDEVRVKITMFQDRTMRAFLCSMMIPSHQSSARA